MEEFDKRDRRVERTRDAIISTFKEMIIEKEFKEITIKELSERANINRKTFYLHYESIEELLYDLTLELSDLIYETLNKKGFFEAGNYDMHILVDTINDTINNNYELTKKLVSANSYRFFSRNIKDLVKDSFIRKVKKYSQYTEYSMNIIGDYVASGVAKILKDWFIDHGNLDSKQISQLCVTLVFGGIKDTSKLDFVK